MRKLNGAIRFIFLTYALVFFGTSAIVRADTIDQLLTPFYDPNSTTTCVGGSVYKFVQTLAYHESSDNPTASNSSGASGKYQYIDSTWQSHAASYYQPAQQYASAKDAPEDVQDALTFIEYSVKYIKFGGDLQEMAVSHIYPEVASDPSQWATYVIGNNPTAQEYADQFIAQYNAADGQGDPLKFSDAPDFSADYLAAVGRPYSAAGDQTGGCTNSGVPADNFVFYSQYDPRWANDPIYTGGGRTIATSGCGPTSAAMVVATLIDSSITPDATGNYMTQIGGYTNDGATVDGLTKTLQHWGLSTQSVSGSAVLNDILSNGGLVIAGGAGSAPFSSGGHVVVIRGIDSSGKYLIGNPAPNLQPNSDPNYSFSYNDLLSAGMTYMIGAAK